MGSAATPMSIAPLVLRLEPLVTLSNDDFYQLCQDNRDLRLERSSRGEVMIMPPTGGETGRKSMRLAGRLDAWTERNGTGVAFDSSTGFALPNGAIRSPDAAWIRRERWEALTPADREGFPPLAPDFVVEIRSPSDRLPDLKAKMEEYRDNGVRLGWLIDPVESRAYVYEVGADVAEIEDPQTLCADPLLPGFTFDPTLIW